MALNSRFSLLDCSFSSIRACVLGLREEYQGIDHGETWNPPTVVVNL